MLTRTQTVRELNSPGACSAPSTLPTICVNYYLPCRYNTPSAVRKRMPPTVRFWTLHPAVCTGRRREFLRTREPADRSERLHRTSGQENGKSRLAVQESRGRSIVLLHAQKRRPVAREAFGSRNTQHWSASCTNTETEPGDGQHHTSRTPCQLFVSADGTRGRVCSVVIRTATLRGPHIGLAFDRRHIATDCLALVGRTFG